MLSKHVMSDNPQELLYSNTLWASKVSELDPNFFTNSAECPQEPHTLWIGCADSRVPESVITASKPGVIFVHRNIANQLPLDDINVLSVLGYAVEHLGVENVIIVGHSGCGGAIACLDAAQDPNFVPNLPITTIPSEPPESPLNRWLQPLTLLAHSLKLFGTDDEALTTLVEENIKAQVENLAKTETINNAWTKGTRHGKKVFIHGWLYELGTGRLRDLGISRGPPN